MRPKYRLSVVMFCLALLFAGEGAAGADTGRVLTERDWMINLIEVLGLSSGLPDTPADADYLQLLGGKRTLRVEAEEHHHPEDMMSVVDFRTFGPFSGNGWVSGINVPTTVRLRFLLPLGGTYRLSAGVRLPGHRFQMGEHSFTADGGNDFTRVELGEARLRAGEHTIQVALPSDGGIDYIELSAPPLPAVEPVGGWKPESPLDLDVMAETAVRLLALEPALPGTGETVRVEAESALTSGEVDITRATHLGEPSGGLWVRTGGRPTRLELAFSASAAGAYDITVRGASGEPVLARVNNAAEVPITLSPYLENVPLGTFPLTAGKNRISLDLPPRAGIDAVLLQRRRASGGDYRKLAGLPLEGSAPTTEQVDTLLSLLTVLGTGR